MGKIFDTDKVVRLGIWGLGRGRSFINLCKALNIEVVAGCDLNQSLCEDFRAICPDAYITADEDDFLAQDMDAVLVATYFFNHAKDSIKVLNSGKHVLSEVTAFFTPADGVRLVEAVEKSGKIYMLAENYTKPFVKKLWQDGVFGELAYAEFDYVHNCRPLSYSYLYGDPIQPGNTAHSWRSWLNFHYYCTHSLGPVMEITSTRPVTVCAPPSNKNLPGYLPESQMGCMQPSLITMDNGGIVRNLIGASTADSHRQQIWGTRAYVDLSGKEPLVSVGQFGAGKMLKLTPEETKLSALEANSGHGGGDIRVLYHFANAVLNGVKPYWDIYAACDATLCGIMAVKSQLNSGVPTAIPDFRDKNIREQYRNDNFSQEHPDPRKIFPENQDISLTKHFTSIINDLDNVQDTRGVPLLLSALDGMKLYKYINDAESKNAVHNYVRKLLKDLSGFTDVLRQARSLAEKYPECSAGKALQSFIDSADPEKLADADALRNELQNFLLTADMPVEKQLMMYLETDKLNNAAALPIPDGFSLRTFQPEYKTAYIQLMRNAGFDYWSSVQADAALKNALDGGIFFLVENATGRLAATAMANKHNEAKPEEGGELGWVGVDPDFRGKKLAAVICSVVLNHYRNAGYKRVKLYTDAFRTPAVKTYLNLGFLPLIPDDDENTKKRWSAVYHKLGMSFE